MGLSARLFMEDGRRRKRRRRPWRRQFGRWRLILPSQRRKRRWPRRSLITTGTGPGAAEGFKKAIQLDPGYSTAYQRYSLYLSAMGKFDDSFDQIKKARELEPLSISINASLGWRLYLAREYDRAIAQLRDTLEMDPASEWAHLNLGQAYEQKGQFGPAIEELQKALELSHSSPLTLSALAHAEALAGNHAAANKLLAQLEALSKKQYVSPYYVAIVYLGLGKNDLAMDWLEKAFTDRSNGLVFLKVEPELDPLRSNPRFIALQNQTQLPELSKHGCAEA